MSDDSTSPQQVLHACSESLNNTHAGNAAIRLVPKTPPQLLESGSGQSHRDPVYSRTPLPTIPSHFLEPPKGTKAKTGFGFEYNNSAGGAGGGDGGTSRREKGKEKETISGTGPALAEEFHRNIQASTTTPTPSAATRPLSTTAATGSPSSRPKPPPKKRLQIHKNNKTFSLLHIDETEPAYSAQDDSRSPTSKFSSDSLLSDPADNATSESNLIGSCVLPGQNSTASPKIPSTPALENKPVIPGYPISNSPWNYQLVGGLRKVPKTPDLKSKANVVPESSVPSLPESSDAPASSHDLASKPSFGSTDTSTTATDNTNYKVYRSDSGSTSEAFPPPPSSSNSNYQVIRSDSTSSSVIHRPQTGTSEGENYEVYGDPTPSTSQLDFTVPQKYSHESLVVPPLKPRARKSNESIEYHERHSRDTARTTSLTSISIVLSQQEAFRAVLGPGTIIQTPTILKAKPEASSSWANPLRYNPTRTHMNEHPHQWSSQLSTVMSVSDGGTDRGSRTWSDGRISSGFPSSNSRQSRRMLSISSSMMQEETPPPGEMMEPPTPIYLRDGSRYHSNSSLRLVEDPDEYGDGITGLQNLRARPSRSRLSGFYSISESGRSNTMRSTRSTTSTRTNNSIKATIPTWARLYYGSGERRYLGTSGSSTEGTDSRTSSFRSYRSGSPNPDHFPLSIYSPRRRPREVNRDSHASARGSMEITPAPVMGENGRLRDPHANRFRTWSMSSMWSPHLRADRRATRQTVWEPPSIRWSSEGGMFGRRNIQVVMFVAGFLFPCTWMVAGLLPLPPSPIRAMSERDTSTSNLDGSNLATNDYARHFGPMDEVRYESARWWRGLNRWMSIVGLLIIIAVVVLAILGTREQW